MSRLPNAHDRSVGLHLIDIASLDPDLRRLSDHCLHDGLRYDGCRGLNDHRFAVARPRHGIARDTADHAADEAGPEVAPATSPPIATAGPARPARRTRPARTAHRPARATSAPSSATAPAPTRPRKHTGSSRHHSNHKHHFLHDYFPFWLLPYVPLGKPTRLF